VRDLKEIVSILEKNYKKINLRRINSWMNKSGEHYKLLACIVKHIKPKIIIELGSGKEAFSSTVIANYCNGDQIIYSFDIIHNLAHLNKENLIYSTDDIVGNIDKYQYILLNAEFIFIDTEHTGDQETQIMRSLFPLLRKNTLLMFDDIHLNQAMKNFWNGLDKHFYLDKQDITPLGHWSGTGVALKK
jgi:predicted O-methyltransferase YrrM